MKLLHVSAPGAVLRESTITKEHKSITTQLACCIVLCCIVLYSTAVPKCGTVRYLSLIVLCFIAFYCLHLLADTLNSATCLKMYTWV